MKEKDACKKCYHKSFKICEARRAKHAWWDCTMKKRKFILSYWMDKEKRKEVHFVIQPEVSVFRIREVGNHSPIEKYDYPLEFASYGEFKAENALVRKILRQTGKQKNMKYGKGNELFSDKKRFMVIPKFTEQEEEYLEKYFMIEEL